MQLGVRVKETCRVIHSEGPIQGTLKTKKKF